MEEKQKKRLKVQDVSQIIFSALYNFYLKEPRIFINDFVCIHFKDNLIKNIEISGNLGVLLSEILNNDYYLLYQSLRYLKDEGDIHFLTTFDTNGNIKFSKITITSQGIRNIEKRDNNI